MEMKRRGKIAAMLAAAVTVTTVLGTTMTGYAGIEDFLSGGSSGSTNTTDYSGLYDTGDDSGSGQTGTSGTQTGTDSAQTMSQTVNMVTCTDSQTGLNVARAAVPADYAVQTETTWCGPVQCPDYPASVLVHTMSPDASIQMTYESTIGFIEIQNTTINGVPFVFHQDWTFNTDYCMTMLQYMNASQYCDYVSQNCMPNTSNMTFVSEKPISQEDQAILQQCAQEQYDNMNQLLASAGLQGTMSVPYSEVTASERTYRFTDEYGKSKILVVSCASNAVDLETHAGVPGMTETVINIRSWTIPARYCLIVDEDKYDEGYQAFESFSANTRVSDQFVETCKKMRDSIMQAIMNAKSSTIASQSSYVQDSFTSELSGVDDSYSVTDGWDDVIMERNDYTLSNGDSVKVDTSYDYVYELDDGSVYATNSALDEPGGSTLLYAN